MCFGSVARRAARARFALAIALGGALLLVLSSGCIATSHYYCEGMASACSGRTELTCQGGDGCSWESSCVGFECWNVDNESMCEQFPACEWDAPDGGDANCAQKPSSTCNLAEADCKANSTCNWVLGCNGQVVECSTLATDSACGQTPGCHWTAESAI